MRRLGSGGLDATAAHRSDPAKLTATGAALGTSLGTSLGTFRTMPAFGLGPAASKNADRDTPHTRL
jgi:hypothetical protein